MHTGIGGAFSKARPELISLRGIFGKTLIFDAVFDVAIVFRALIGCHALKDGAGCIGALDQVVGAEHPVGNIFALYRFRERHRGLISGEGRKNVFKHTLRLERRELQ
jgi:hypothetical protein